MSSPARAVFLGSGDFAVPIAQALAEHPRADLVAVVTTPARPAGRGRRERPTPIWEWARRRELPTLAPLRLRDQAALDEIGRLGPELFVLADYGQIVPIELLELPRHGALNLHPSLLPRHRGASPVAAALLAGDERTGVSLMQMDAGLDTGPLIAQRELAVDDNETAPQLEARLAQLAAVLLTDVLGEWLDGRLSVRPQPAEGASLTRPLRRQDGALDARRPAVELARQVRAYQPWPGSYLETHEGRLLVWAARVTDADGGTGQLVRAPSGNPALVTVEGVLELVEVQPAGGRRMSGAELLRGRRALVSG